MDEQKSHTPLTTQEQKDEEMINAAFQRLLDTYLATNHRRKVDLITKAFNFAKQAHKGVRRRSGEPYILHPIAVAQIACGEIGLGSTSICAALLHDVEEDTDYTNEDLSNLFGPKIANIVEGVTKISGGIFGEKASLQAETFKKLLLMMSDDIRVILIKISDRLHNMRTLASMLPSKQYKIAAETLYIFAPIADRLGLSRIKTELENLSFRYEHPEEYEAVLAKIDQSKIERDDIIARFTPPIKERLDALGVNYTIKARVKSPYSIWLKMQKKHIPFEEVFDILAIRIIFTPKDRQHEKDECFRIYSALTEIYKPHPTRFRDWLSNPKTNGYQALHNTFMSAQGKWVEVQIRSDRMDDIAEIGFAAHWKYKDKEAAYDETELDRWLNSIKEILDDPQPDTLDLLDNIKLNLYAAEIMVFTPKGELKSMPKGATALDFAYAIHTTLGSHCIGAKVNHRLVPLSYQLRSGDQVEILISRNSQVHADWLDYATTAKARAKIQATLRKQARDNQARGQQLLKQFLDEQQQPADESMIDRIRKTLRQPSVEQLYQRLGEGTLVLSPTLWQQIKEQEAASHGHGQSRWRRFIPFMANRNANDSKDTDATDDDNKTETDEQFGPDWALKLNRKETLRITDEVLAHCSMADCCHPIPGDDVMGYITPAGELELHKRSCETALKLKSRYGNNIIATSWSTHRTQLHNVNIAIRGIDAQGVLYSIADLLHKLTHFNLRQINLNTNDGIFDGTLTIAVYDTSDVEALCTRLKEIENITEATRV